MNSIQTRLAKIENQLRVQRRIIVFLFIMLVAGISFGATAPIPEVIRANRFEAVNKNGRVGAVMAAFRGHGDGVFRAYNRAGVEVFYAGSSGTGDGRVEIKNKRGKINVELSGRK